MEIFKLIGRIVVENNEANKNIDETAQKSEKAKSKITSAFSKIGKGLVEAFKSDKAKKFGETLEGVTKIVDKQENELSSLKNKYKDLYLTHGENSKEAKEVAKEIERLSKELKENKSKLGEAEKAADKFDNSLDDVGETSEKTESKLSGAMKKIGTAIVTAFAIDKIKDFGMQIAETAAEVSAEQSAYEQIMGDFADSASAKMQQVADVTKIADTRLTPYMTSLTAKFKGLGFDIDTATTLASDGLELAADASAFWDKSLEDAMGGLNSFINGSYEGGEAIGLFANDTQLAAYAVKQGIVSQTSDWANLEESVKQATRLDYAKNMMEASGATGQAAKEADQYANIQANLTEKWRQFQALIGEPILQNIVVPAIAKLNDILDFATQKFNLLKDKMPEIKQKFKEVGDYINGTFSPVIDTLKTLFEKTKEILGKVKKALDPFIDKIKNDLKPISDDLKDFFSSGKEGAEGLRVVLLITTIALGTFLTLLGAKAIFTGFVSALKKVKGAFALLNTTMKANPILLIISLIAGLVAGFIYLWNTSEDFRNFWIGLWEGLKSFFSGFVDFISESIDEIGKFFSGLWQGIKDGVNAFKDWIVNKFNAIIDFFKNNWKEIILFIINPFAGAFALAYKHLDGFREKVDMVVNAVKDFFIGLYEKVVNIVTTTFETVKNIITVAIMFIAELFTTAFELITLPFRFIWENCKELVFAVWDWIKEKISNTVTSIKDFIVERFTVIKTFIVTAFTFVKDKVVEIWNVVYSFISGIATKIYNFFYEKFTAIKNFIISIFTVIKDKIVEIWNAVYNFIKDLLTKILNFFKIVFNTIKDFIISVFTTVKNKIIEIWNVIKTFIINVLNSIKMFITNIFNGIKNIIFDIWNGIKNVVSNAVNSIKDNVSNVFNGVKNTVSNIFNSVKDNVSNIWNKIKEAITKPINDAKNNVKNGIDKIKSFFNFTWSLPKLKMPHFKIDGKFSLNPPSVPKFGIEWYKDGGIMEDPTLFGFNPFTNKAMVGGEAGAEAITPISVLLDYVRTAVQEENRAMSYKLDKLIALLDAYFPQILENLNKEIYLDNGVLVGELAPKMDIKLGGISRNKDRGQ